MLSLVPAAPQVDIDHGDKLGHLAAYGLLMSVFCLIYDQWRTRLAYAAGFIAMGIALEFVQGTTGTRTMEGLDMLANALGVLLGLAAGLALRSSRMRR